MENKKKIIMGVIFTIAILAVVIGVSVTVGKKTESSKESENVNGTTLEQITTAGEEVTFVDETDKDDNKEETNFWDNVEVIEETDSSEVKTDKNGETVTEAYPGADSGWSPIVSPEDLEENK